MTPPISLPFSRRQKREDPGLHRSELSDGLQKDNSSLINSHSSGFPQRRFGHLPGLSFSGHQLQISLIIKSFFVFIIYKGFKVCLLFWRLKGLHTFTRPRGPGSAPMAKRKRPWRYNCLENLFRWYFSFIIFSYREKNDFGRKIPIFALLKQ